MPRRDHRATDGGRARSRRERVQRSVRSRRVQGRVVHEGHSHPRAEGAGGAGLRGGAGVHRCVLAVGHSSRCDEDASARRPRPSKKGGLLAREQSTGRAAGPGAGGDHAVRPEREIQPQPGGKTNRRRQAAAGAGGGNFDDIRRAGRVGDEFAGERDVVQDEVRHGEGGNLLLHQLLRYQRGAQPRGPGRAAPQRGEAGRSLPE
mmetsp:Transcript_14385/g.35899  ORF Transcript_14385/g.35899 Transcript_14385/m.35899 type:complete len:204 (+) Transcript_14385:1290-1901(+)